MKWSIPERVIEEGRECAKEGRVVSWSKNEERRMWYAEVMGAEVLYVELDGTAKEDDVCQCVYWQQHGYCKHTVAVELAMRDQGVSRFIKKTDQPVVKKHEVISPATIFTKGFQQLESSELRRLVSDIVPLKITYELSIVETSPYYKEHSVMALHIRVGLKDDPKRSYMVKNIDEFIESYKKEQNIRINSLNWVITPRAFNAQDNIFMERLIEIKNQQIILSHIQQGSKQVLDKRYLVLNKSQAADLIDSSSDDDRFSFKLDKKIVKSLVIRSGKLPINIKITPVGEEDYELSIHDTFDYYLEDYRWLVSSEVIYSLSDEQAQSYEVLTQMMKRMKGPTIFFTQSQVSSLFSYVIPHLSLLTKIKMPDDLVGEFIRYPLRAVIHFSKVNHMIHVRTDFHYGDYVFSNEAEYSSKIGQEDSVVRDKVQEERLLVLLKHYGYGIYHTPYTKPLPEKQGLYAFFTTEIPMWKKYTTVELSDELEELYLTPGEQKPSAFIQENGSWLDIKFDISSIDESEVNQVLLSLIDRQDYHQLASGQLIDLTADTFKETSHVLQKLRDDIRFADGVIEVPTYRGLSIDHAMGSLNNVSSSTSFETMVSELVNPDSLEVSLPKTLKATLRDYQVTGFKWFKLLSKYQFGGILADDMGLGKTVQTIAYLLSEKEEGTLHAPSVIVAPASLLYNWQLELSRFAPNLKVLIVNGSKQERLKQLSNVSDNDIVIVSYSTIRQDIALFKQETFHSVILDEAQMIKNAATKTFQAISSLKTPRRFALSGTPIENKLEELWSLFRILMPGFFPSIRKFKELPTSTIATIIQPFVLRRVKKDVLKDLPDKIETDMYSQLKDEQKTVYLAYLQKMQESIAGMSSGEFNKQRLTILAGLTRLRQICCHPGLFIEDYEGGSGKMDQALDLIDQAKSNGRRVLLFSQFTSMLTILEDALNEREISSFYLRGSTPIKERQELVNRFNRGEKDVFLISLKAGGTGLNLTGADTVILYDLWWNPAVEDQATGRAHRIGQTQKVEVWRLMAEGTIEERMNQLQQEKKSLFQQVLHSEEAPNLSSMTMDDIKSILEFGDDE